MKYAFVGRTEGVIRIRTTRNDTGLHIEYGDDGVGIANAAVLENSSGFGMELIRALVDQLHGSITLEQSSGTAFTIEFAV